MTTMPLQPGSPAILALCLAGWFLLVNVLTFVAFRLDKRRAMAGEWRVPETTLLMLATLGGWPGAKCAQLLYRHKTRKQPFRTILNLSVLPLLGVMAFMLSPGVDWQKLAGFAAPTQTAEAAAPVAPKKPAVRDMTKAAASKAASVTDNPDLPKRIGPGPTKTGAWHSR